MKAKVAEASGVVLDYMVAKCEGYKLYKDDMGTLWLLTADGYLHDDVPLTQKKYSTNPAQSWPIIDREITGVDLVSEWKGVKKWSARKFEYLPNDQTRCTEQYGPTLLIAAMRCLVASRLGEEVEVPDELMET